MSWTRLHELIGPYGIATYDAAVQAGVPRATFVRQLGERGWAHPFSSVWLRPGTPWTPKVKMAAALAHVGDGAMVTGWSSLNLFGLADVAPTKIHVALPHRRRIPSHPLIRTTRPTILEHEVAEVDRLATTTVPRTLGVLARETSVDALRGVALQAQQRRLLEPGGLVRVAADHPCLAGRRKLVIVEADLARDGSESGFEFTARSRMAAVGLRPDREQVTVRVNGRRRRIDIPWANVRVGVECQSIRYHALGVALTADARRRNELIGEADWIILELTSEMFWEGWDDFIAQLASLLTRRAAELGVTL